MKSSINAPIKGSMKGYMFSFDAMLGFLVSLVIIYTLLLLITMPYGYYYEFEQAYATARDTGLMMYSADWDDAETYSRYLAGEIVKQNAFSDLCYNSDKGLRQIIPGQYAFTIEYYNFTDHEWKVLCARNATYDTKISCAEFRKFKVYAPLLIADYAGKYYPGDMPYCYVSCKGYEGGGDYAPDGECVYTPCDITTDLSTRPPIYTGLVRIGVCI
jgi:hypothetical protein